MKENFHQVDVPILSNSECNNLFKLAALDEHVSEDIWVCAGYREGGKDACDVSFVKINLNIYLCKDQNIPIISSYCKTEALTPTS